MAATIRPWLFLACLLGTLVSVPEPAAAATCQGPNGSEDFEDGQPFFRPGYPGTGTCLYTYGAAQPGYIVTNPVAPGSTRAFFPNGDWPQFDLVGGDLCTSANPNGLTFRFKFRTEANPPPATNNVVVGISIGVMTGQSASLSWQNDMIPEVYIRSNNGQGQVNNHRDFPGAVPLAANTWYAGFVSTGCNAGGAAAGIDVDLDGDIDYGASLGSIYGGWGATGIPGNVGYVALAEGAQGGPAPVGVGGGYLDDLEVSGYPTVSPATNFCPDPSKLDVGGDPYADYEYNFVDSTKTFDESSLSPADFEDGFVMESDDVDGVGDNDPASMGKGWTGTVRSAEVWFRLEAGVEGKETNFRAVFSFDSAVPSITSVGDVRTTGSFADHVAVRIKEFGNSWRMQLEYVSGGNGPTQVGPAWLGLHPNTATNFIFRVNTTAANPHFGLYLADGREILNQSLNQGSLAAKIDDYLYAQWFVAEGGSALLGDAFTYLDDNEPGESHNSTCIFIGPGSSLIGGVGTIPGSAAPDLTQPDPPAGDDDGSDTLLGAFGLSENGRFLFGIAVLIGYLLIARRKLDHDADTSRIVVLVLWIALVWLGSFPIWMLVVAGVVGVAMFSKAGTRILGG